MSKCPLFIVRSAADYMHDCKREECEFWNERFERCSVFVIGDRIDDLAVVMEKEVESK